MNNDALIGTLFQAVQLLFLGLQGHNSLDSYRVRKILTKVAVELDRRDKQKKEKENV